MKRLLIATVLCLSAVFGVSVAQAHPGGGAVVVRPGGGAVVVRPGWDRVGRADVIGGHRAIAVDPRFGPGVTVPTGRAYFGTHAVRYRDGFYYRGLNHAHWGHRHWDAGCGRFHYWDPYLRCYYFYDTVRLGYYPVAPIVIQPWMLP